MNVWLIEPLDPLIARDGRPSAVGGRFTTTSFPFPSMVAGAVRTRMGSEEGAFTLPRHALAELKEKVLVRGPLLAELCSEEGTIRQWLAPAPRDAMILDTGDGVQSSGGSLQGSLSRGRPWIRLARRPSSLSASRAPASAANPRRTSRRSGPGPAPILADRSRRSHRGSLLPGRLQSACREPDPSRTSEWRTGGPRRHALSTAAFASSTREPTRYAAAVRPFALVSGSHRGGPRPGAAESTRSSRRRAPAGPLVPSVRRLAGHARRSARSDREESPGAAHPPHACHVQEGAAS